MDVVPFSEITHFLIEKLQITDRKEGKKAVRCHYQRLKKVWVKRWQLRVTSLSSMTLIIAHH